MDLIGTSHSPSRAPKVALTALVIVGLLGGAAFGVMKLMGSGPSPTTLRSPATAAPALRPVKIRAGSFSPRALARIRFAQDTARNGILAHEVYYIDNITYKVPLGTLEEIEPALRYTRGASTSARTVSVWNNHKTAIVAVKGGAGVCVAIRKNIVRGIDYAAAKAKDGDCVASAFRTLQFRARW